MTSTAKKRELYEDFLANVPLLKVVCYITSIYINRSLLRVFPSFKIKQHIVGHKFFMPIKVVGLHEK